MVGSGSGCRPVVIRAPERRGDVPTSLRRFASGAGLSPAIGSDRKLCNRRRCSCAPSPLRPASSLDAPLLCLDLFGGGPSSDLRNGGTGRSAQSRARLHLRGLEQLAAPPGGLRDRGALASASAVPTLQLLSEMSTRWGRIRDESLLRSNRSQ